MQGLLRRGLKLVDGRAGTPLPSAARAGHAPGRLAGGFAGVTLALAGAEVLCVPANLVLPFAQAAMVTRAIENGVFTVLVNRTGEDPRPHGRVRFFGRSQVVGPRGELLYRAPAARTTLEVVTLDLRRAHDKRITFRNHLFADRRPERYRVT